MTNIVLDPKSPTFMEDRLALIRKIHKAKKAEAQREKDMLAEMRAEEKALEKFDDPSKDPHHWTDASKYAEKYYGETMRATTQYDNDWG
tara:strand:- start:2995 stop:3261 length:267 start_codon:yes stop_codon:yes gene_type:complete